MTNLNIEQIKELAVIKNSKLQDIEKWYSSILI